jgi:hypothetical protein
MPRWLLTAADHHAPIWETYLIQRLVVEASNEQEARRKVAEAAPQADEPNPWLDPTMTCCEPAMASAEQC